MTHEELTVVTFQHAEMVLLACVHGSELCPRSTP
jgi:hypothetical protein